MSKKSIEGNRVFSMIALGLVGLLVLGLIAIGVVMRAVQMGYWPPASTPEPQPEIEERFATKTLEERYIIQYLLERGYKYVTVNIPKLETAFSPVDPTYSGEEPGVGVFFFVGSLEHVNGVVDTYYAVCFEHALYDTWIFIDAASDGGVETIDWRCSRPTRLEYLLTREPCGEVTFNRPSPGENPELSEAFDLANELISYLK